MRTSILPSFNNVSGMHRTFGDFQASTKITIQPNEISNDLLICGKVSIKVRSWYLQSRPHSPARFIKRYEVYFDGILIDYSADYRGDILKTFHWLVKHPIY